ncbi:MAG TPA: polyprenyl synthetase family protein [Caulobacteraceae bacterium]
MSLAPALEFIAAARPAAVARAMTAYAGATQIELARYLQTQAAAPYLDDLLADYPSRGGKMLRPAICTATARAFGGDRKSAALCAAGIEILHNGLLIHDDIQDGSELRRGRPTLHALHGVPLAINAGDALMFTALRPLIDAFRPFGEMAAGHALDATLTMARETAEGQALELGWRDANVTELGEGDYLRMALKKTAWLGMIWPAQLGLILGSRGRVDAERVVRWGYFLGVAFQIEDDLRNLSAEPGYGKERNGDLFEAKRTLMLIHVHRACEAGERPRLDAFLAAPRAERSPDEVLWLARLMTRLGSVARAQAVAAAMGEAAEQEFAIAFGDLEPSEDLCFLAGLPRWVFERP